MKRNDYSWNQRAHVLYLESPAGVGYSIAGLESDRYHNDTSQSEDALAVLLEFYREFPEYSDNVLFTAGESYGGVYAPYLGYQIDLYNKKTNNKKIPFQGFIVGNGLTSWETDVYANYPIVLYNFNIIPFAMYKTYTDNDCHKYFRDFKPPTPKQICQDTWNNITLLVKELNWYDLFRKNYTLG